MKKLIRVTQEHIDKGNPRHPNSCPIALAMQDKYPTLNINVSYDLIIIIDYSELRIKKIKPPKKIRKFIDDVDRGIKVKPFNFYFDNDNVQAIITTLEWWNR